MVTDRGFLRIPVTVSWLFRDGETQTGSPEAPEGFRVLSGKKSFTL